MTLQQVRATYDERYARFSSSLENVTRKINMISNLRLLTAIFLVVCIYFAFSNDYAMPVAIGAFLLFLYLVKRHSVLFDEKSHLEKLTGINKTELKVMNGDFTSLFDGKSFTDPAHAYTHDLDVFGEGSLFQYLNRCNTLSGRKKFASLLSSPLSTSTKIRTNQEAVKDLAPRVDFRQHLQAAGMETNEVVGDREQLLSWLDQPRFLPATTTFRVILLAVPIITLASLMAVFFFQEAKLVLFPLIIAQWVMAAVYLKRINVFHDYISRKKNILQKYSRILFYLENEAFTSPRMKELSSLAHQAHERVGYLASLVSALDARTNALATVFVNSFLLYDLQVVHRLERWKDQNGKSLPVWLDAITEAEVVGSIGTFAWNNPSFTFPEIHEELAIEGAELGHPLIDEKERVTNDFSIGKTNTVHIITGANMAGKSTFLRTLGVNVILALTGAPVCAKSFKCPVIHLRSGMRTADSLKDHQSYFFAELNRLKSIMDELRSDVPLLVLLDEILKGTNSNDKQTGSIELVKQLLPHPCLALIATHDLALGELEKKYPDKVGNFCFEADIINEELSFDYKLKHGVATRMNASFLMKKMGIIPG